jgi:hypothetical protein
VDWFAADHLDRRVGTKPDQSDAARDNPGTNRLNTPAGFWVMWETRSDGLAERGFVVR